MKWILLIYLFAFNGEGGTHVAWTQVEFESKQLCERAKQEYIQVHKNSPYGATSYRTSRAFCFQVKN